MAVLQSSQRPQLLMMTYDVEQALVPLLSAKNQSILVKEVALKISD